jgi:hypothetical protein
MALQHARILGGAPFHRPENPRFYMRRHSGSIDDRSCERQAVRERSERAMTMPVPTANNSERPANSYLVSHHA